MKHKLPKRPRKFAMFIEGKTTNGGVSQKIVRNSPAHGVPVASWPAGNANSVNQAVTAARKSFASGVWARMHVRERAKIMHKAAELINAKLEEFALVESLETGKPITQARAEMGGVVNLWQYAAGACRTITGESYNNLGENLFALTIRQPIGVVGAIIPWNFPLIVLSERLPFILAAGCSAVIKPAEQTSGTAVMLAQILHKAGLPAGVVNIVTGYGPDVGQPLLEHTDIDMISFTGSTEIGRLAIKSAATNIKQIGLELGGKNPFLVFADADIKGAADAAAFSMSFNAGQCCVSASRLIVHKSIEKKFSQELAKRIAKIKVGDPLDEKTQVGAIFEQQHFDKILNYINNSNTKVLVGGKRCGSNKGLFIQPTLLTGAATNSPIYREEVFGPVMTIHTFTSYEQGLRMANDTSYGLSATIWSQSISNCLKAYRDIDAGRIWINTVMEDGPETPLGGCKESGIGREVGVMGIQAYTEVKTANINLGPRDLWQGK